MTAIQGFMLAVCFGAVLGTFIGNVITIIGCIVQERCEKKNGAQKKEYKD